MFGRSSAAGSGARARHGRTTSAAAAPQRTAAKLTFAAGDRVSHKTFGDGKVTKVDGDTVYVYFSKLGQTKKLLKDYAPLVKRG